jgi:class 3 adenylate cyclase
MTAVRDVIGQQPGEPGGDAALHVVVVPAREVSVVPPRHVTLVHSDIVGSTPLLAAAGPRYPGLLRRHREIVARAAARRGGEFLSYAGDSTLALFAAPEDALAAAAEAQRALAIEPWPDGLAPRVRMGVHAGEVYDLDGEPVGLAINHGARIMSAAAAGQVLVSDIVADAVARAGRPADAPALADAGWHDLRDHAGLSHLHQIVGL